MKSLLSAAQQTDQSYLELHMRERETEDMQSSARTDLHFGCTSRDIEDVFACREM